MQGFVEAVWSRQSLAVLSMPTYQSIMHFFQSRLASTRVMLYNTCERSCYSVVTRHHHVQARNQILGSEPNTFLTLNFLASLPNPFHIASMQSDSRTLLTSNATAGSSSSAGGKPDRLYVGNLAPTVDEYTLIQVFSKYGKITKMDFMFHKTGVLKGKPRGFAFIEFSNKDVSNDADHSSSITGLSTLLLLFSVHCHDGLHCS